MNLNLAILEVTRINKTTKGYLKILLFDVVSREKSLLSITATFPPFTFILVNLDHIARYKA